MITCYRDEFVGTTAAIAVLAAPAGAGKTTALLKAAVTNMGAGYNAVVVARENTDTLVSASEAIYPTMGGVFKGNVSSWLFPDGSAVILAAMPRDDEKDLKRFKAMELDFVGFDDAHLFPTNYRRHCLQWQFMCSRLKSDGMARLAYSDASSLPLWLDRIVLSL